jgi:2,3-bisphosphoglycerate-independent phosphoglycerate mutase
MDRDNRWERVEQAYHNMVVGSGHRHPLSLNALNRSYVQEINDEFVLPQVTDFAYEGMQDGDSLIFFNFRPDRAREITRAFTQPDFDGFERKKVLKNLHFACFSPYDETFDLPIAFPKSPLNRLLAELISEQGIKQFHTAETEKYAHVTFFFNGGIEQPFPGEDRKLIPSPKVATYDMQPEMSLQGVVDAVLEALNTEQYGFIIVNFANPDMVGHTGVMGAAVDAVKSVDRAIQQVSEAVLAQDGVMILTADHGNVEKMVDEVTGEPHTAHTINPVPFILISNNPDLGVKQGEVFGLSSIAPTVLQLMNLPVPSEMTAPSILSPASVSV